MNRFFCVEGLEGASKSTSIATIQDVFREHNVNLTLTREPGGTPMAEELRRVIKSTWKTESVDLITELLIMFAARNQLYNNVIRPALQTSSVLSDRGWWSTYAYQLNGRSADGSLRVLFHKILDQVIAAQRYDSVLFLDVDPEVGMKRARSRGELDRFEIEQIDFFHRARQGYLELANTQPNVTIIDANGTREDVQYKVRQWALTQVYFTKT